MLTACASIETRKAYLQVHPFIQSILLTVPTVAAVRMAHNTLKQANKGGNGHPMNMVIWDNGPNPPRWPTRFKRRKAARRWRGFGERVFHHTWYPSQFNYPRRSSTGHWHAPSKRKRPTKAQLNKSPYCPIDHNAVGYTLCTCRR